MAKIRQLKLRPGGFNSALFELSVGNGDIPEIDDKVFPEAQAVMKHDFENADFQRCYNQLFINGKSLCDNPRVRGTGLYLLFSIMNHSCVANTYTMLNQDGNIQVSRTFSPLFQTFYIENIF